MQLHKTSTGVELAQEGFIRELLRAHKHNGPGSSSQGSRDRLLLFLRRLRPTRTTGFRSTGLMKEGPKTLFMFVFGELCLFVYFGFICFIFALFVVK